MSDYSALIDIAPWLLLILAAEFVNGWTDADLYAAIPLRSASRSGGMIGRA